MSNNWLVVGLGNPGPDYSRTRHNIGFMVVEELAHRMSTSFRSNKSRALVAEGRLAMGGPKIVLAKPQTFMNLSGEPTAALAKFFNLDIENIIVVHDEIDIPFGLIKLKVAGGEGGHNGLRDISRSLGRRDYYRVRVGVGRPPGNHGDAASHVLKDFSSAEKKELSFLIQDAAEAVEMIVTSDLTTAQQRFHAPK